MGQTNRQTDKQTDKQTDRHTGSDVELRSATKKAQTHGQNTQKNVRIAEFF